MKEMHFERCVFIPNLEYNTVYGLVYYLGVRHVIKGVVKGIKGI